MHAERRRFPRYRVEIKVHLRQKGRMTTLRTADVSRHGAYVKTHKPKSERELVQLTFLLPEGKKVEAMCMVARSYGQQDKFPLGAGMGVDLFAISKGAKNDWDQFVQGLKIRDTSARPSFALADSALADGLFSPSGERNFSPEELEASGEGEQLSFLEADPSDLDEYDVPGNGESAEEIHTLDLADAVSCFLVRLKNQVELEEFYRTDLKRGGIFLPTPVEATEGDAVQLILVHPDTHGEFNLDGRVALVDQEGPLESRGIGVQFDPLDSDQLEALRKFIGITDLNKSRTAPANVEARIQTLRDAVAADPFSVTAYLALGRCLLDDAGETEEAVATLRSAVLCDPTAILAHRLLERGLNDLGDSPRAEAHGMVAQALEKMLN
jgi:Tfp pilus assembly protein PilZ